MSPNFQTQAGIISYPSSRGKQSTDLRGKPITYYFLSLSWKTRTKTMKKMKHWRGSFLYQWLKPFGFWSLLGRKAWRWSFLSSSFYCLSTHPLQGQSDLSLFPSTFVYYSIINSQSSSSQLESSLNPYPCLRIRQRLSSLCLLLLQRRWVYDEEITWRKEEEATAVRFKDLWEH